MKSSYLSVLVFLFVSAISCTKNNTPENVQEALPTGTILASGNFMSNVHSTSGSAKIVQESSGKKYLVFENFRTDNGPDLHVWLSPNTSANPYQTLGKLKAVNGNFFYELSSNINYVVNNRVLIWCEDFSVLFGSTALQ